MSSSAAVFPTEKNTIMSWEFVLITLLFCALVGVMLSHPTGSISGRLALQQEGFNLYTYDMKEHHVYAMAIGPRGDHSEERGVWVNPDGTFRIDQLSVGEYELKVHVPGFATSFDSGIFVEDGKVTKLPSDVALQLQDPSISVASNARVYTTKEQPSFWVNGSGASRVDVSVYKFDMLETARHANPKACGFEVNAEMNLYKPYESESKKTAMDYFKDKTPMQTWTRQLKSDSSDYSRQDFKFSKSLAPGDYFVIVQASNLQKKRAWNIHYFTVTDIGLIVKQDPEKTLVRAVNLTTLQPEQGVAVTLFDRQQAGKELAKATTAADGFASVKRVLTSDSSSLLVYGARAEHHTYGGFSFYSHHTDNYETFFYTDRPVYRLGQTMYYKGIARRHKLEGFANPGADVKLKWSIEDPDNTEIKSGFAKTNSHGTFHGTFDIPKEGKTGAYQITVRYPDNTVSYERFEVNEYRKPEYIVDVTPVVARVSAGQKAKARIHAKYYFGAPVTNAKVKYTVFSSIDWASRYALEDRPAYYSFFDGWDHTDDSYSEGGYGGDYLSEGTATTDANGDAVIEFDTRKGEFDKNKPWQYDHYDKRYKIQAEVTDLSRLTVEGSGALSVTNGEFALFTKSSTSVARVGEDIVADVAAIRYDGKKQPGLPVHVQLYRRIYDRKSYDYKGIEVCGETTGTTDANGNVRVNFHTKPQFVTDNYDILATAEDSHHNFVADDYSVWVVSENNPYYLSEDQAQKEPLTLKLDKPVYQPGDVAKVMITAPLTGKEGAQAIVAVEGAKIYNYRVINMTATAQMVEVPLSIDYAPNVYVTVTVVTKKRQYYNQSEMIKVTPEKRFLDLTIATDKPKYHPGDLCTYTVTAKTKDGKPAANVELSLGVVDESIYAIRADATPDIRRFFYEQRPNVVITMCTFPEQYSGGPDKVTDVRIRKDFRDTAVWMPELVTDANGVAKASLKMPDNLTTWRATVRAISMNTEVGSTINKVISTQDLILRIATPRFFTQGDQGVISAVIHNYTDQPQPIDLSMDMTGGNFTTTDSLKQKVVVFPDKAKRVNWNVNAVTAGEAVLTCKAIGSTARDAMQTKVPIHPLGVETFTAKAGVVTGDDATISLPGQLPSDAAPGSVKYHLYLSSSALGTMLGNFSSLIDYPYGCTEQTMSKLMPAVVAIRLNQTFGAPLTVKDKKKFDEVYKQSMEKLNGYQHDDGGWGWWANDTSSVYLTALVLDGYKLLEDAGYAVELERSEKGQEWLKTNALTEFKQLSDPLHKPSWNDVDSMVDVARAYCVLSKYGHKIPVEVLKWAGAHKQRFTPEGLAYFSIALQNNGNRDMAKVYYGRLMQIANETQSPMGMLVNWAPTKKLCSFIEFDKRVFDRDYFYYSYRFTGVESTALALEAMAALEPTNEDRIEAVKRWIMTERGRDGWENTKTTSEVFRALMAVEVGARKVGKTTDFTAEVAVPGGTATPSLSFDNASIIKPEKDVTLQMTKTGGEIKLHKKGPGRLYYSSVLSYYRMLKPGEQASAKGIPDGLNVKREFFRLVPSAPDSNGNVHFTAQKLPNRQVKAGETILMKVYVDAPVTAPYVCLQAPLPSGAEVVENDSRADEAKEATSGTQANSEGGGYNFGNWWWTHQDIMDDHIAFFVTDFPSGKAELHQMIRMEIPGKFQINPVKMEGMYTKGIRCHSTTDEITVTE